MKNTQTIDLYNMVGFCPNAVYRQSFKFALKNIVDANDLEVQALKNKLVHFILQKVFLLPEKWSGLVLGGGSEANEIALLLAKRTTKRNVVITTNLGHSSVGNAAKKLGMRVVIVDVDPKNLQANSQKIQKTLGDYKGTVALVNTTFGTTQLGTTENYILDKELLCEIRENKIWLHIDAAYGGIVNNLSGNRLPQYVYDFANSITVDPHKFFGVLGCGVLLVQNQNDVHLLGNEAEYFQANLSCLGTTRSALPVAVACKMIDSYGLEGLTKIALRCLKRAKKLENNLQNIGLETIVPVESGVVPILLKSDDEVEKVKSKLSSAGFGVSPVLILGKNYEINGIRVVATPKKEITMNNLNRFAKSLNA